MLYVLILISAANGYYVDKLDLFTTVQTIQSMSHGSRHFYAFQKQVKLQADISFRRQD